MLRFLVLILLVSVTVAVGWSQTRSLPVAPAQSSSVEGKQDGVSSTPTFTVTVRSNLVQVRVVVRDAGDKPVTGLKAEDFRILDKGQLQTISTFTVETPELNNQKETSRVRAQPPGSVNTPTLAPPERFVALVFDDANLSSKDTVQIKNAAQLLLKSAIGRDRIGIYSTSGQITQEFTSDTEALRRALLRVVPRSMEVTNDRQ
jgi:VWFA-related protein